MSTLNPVKLSTSKEPETGEQRNCSNRSENRKPPEGGGLSHCNLFTHVTPLSNLRVPSVYWFSVKRRLVENANALLHQVSILV